MACETGREDCEDSSAKEDRCCRANVEMSNAMIRVLDGMGRTFGEFSRWNESIAVSIRVVGGNLFVNGGSLADD